MVPMLPNWDHITQMLQLCDGLGVDRMSCLRFVPQTRGRNSRMKLSLHPHEFMQMQKDFVALLAENYKCQLRLGCPIDFRHTVDNSMTAKAKPCHAGKDLILVRPQGDVHPCAAWKTLPDTDNVRNSSLTEIWHNSAIFNELRTYHEGKYLERLDTEGHGCMCRNCRYRESCLSGCLAQRLHWLSYVENRDVGIDGIYETFADPLCPIR